MQNCDILTEKMCTFVREILRMAENMVEKDIEKTWEYGRIRAENEQAKSSCREKGKMWKTCLR